MLKKCIWHKNRKIKHEEYYDNNKRHGMNIWRDENGVILSIEYYEEGAVIK